MSEIRNENNRNKDKRPNGQIHKWIENRVRLIFNLL